MTGEEEFRAVAAAHPEATDIHAEEGGLCFVRERGRLIRETAGDLLPWLISRLPPERREELAERGACDGRGAVSMYTARRGKSRRRCGCCRPWRRCRMILIRPGLKSSPV